MVTEGILNIICSLFLNLVNILPTFSVSNFLSDASIATQFLSWVAWANYYFPVDRLPALIGIVLSAQLVGAVLSSILNLL